MAKRNPPPSKMFRLVELEDGRLAYNVPEFAEATGLGKSTIFEEIGKWRRGDKTGLRPAKRGGRTLILREDGVAWLRAGRETVDAPDP
jgi:hypothetical protein